jgi:hypothetical protein
MNRTCIPAFDRVMSRVKKRRDGCWLWTGRRTPKGYGYARHEKREDGTWSELGVHRIVYQELVGPIPAEYTIDHLCRVKHCVNPEHLEAVTRTENIKRGYASRGYSRR